ncbi:MAG: hypothetical protein ACOY93_05640 [Bacillota bacterium]
MLLYIFLGLGAFWAVLGVVQLVESWGQVDGMKAALTSLIMAALNVGIAWYLHHRAERRRASR